MNPIKCCRDCPNRYVGCHSECTMYKAEKTRYEQTKAATRKAKEREIDLFYKNRR